MKTELDLYQSANAFAAETLNEQNEFVISEKAIAAFKASGAPDSAWKEFQRMFRDQRSKLRNLARRQLSKKK